MNNKYYFLNRPPSIGTHPSDEIEREVWQPIKDIPGTNRHAHGWVEYANPLGFDQIWKYDLYPADKQELNEYNNWRDENNK